MLCHQCYVALQIDGCDLSKYYSYLCEYTAIHMHLDIFEKRKICLKTDLEKKERLASTYHVVLLSSETACPYSFFARETRAVTNFRRSRLLSNMLIKRRTRKGYVLVKPRIRKGMWHTQRLCATLAAYPQWLCGTETAYMQQSATGMCYSSR